MPVRPLLLCVISMSSVPREREIIFILVFKTDQMNGARVSLRAITEFTFDSILVIFL